MNATTDNYTEQLVFFYVIRNYDIATAFKGVYFQNPILKSVFEVVQPHIINYREEPTEDQVYALLQRDPRPELTNDIIHTLWQTRSQLSQYSEEWIRMTTKGFAEWNNFIVAVNRMHSYMMTTQYDITPETAHEYVQKVKAMFSADAQFQLMENVGHDFFDPAEHRQSVVETASTGYKFFDLCLKGGWAKKTLNIIMGPPKIGKSMWLCNLCANSVIAGHNSAYISLEMSYQIVNQRIGANLLSIPMSEYDKHSQDENYIKNKLKEFYNQSFNTPGALIVEEYPTSSATVYDIEAFLLNAEKARSTEDKPFKFRNIFIDYVNIMADAKRSGPGDTYIKIKNICEDVRAMAQRNDWCVISLTQTNRNGMNASDLEMGSVAESSALIQTVDSLFGIISTSIMKAEGIYYIKALALRNSPNMGDKKKYNFIGDFMRIKEDETEPIIPDTTPLPSHLTLGASDGTGSNMGGWKPAKKFEPNTNSQNGGQAPMKPSNNLQPEAPVADLGVLTNQIQGRDLFNV